MQSQEVAVAPILENQAPMATQVCGRPSWHVGQTLGCHSCFQTCS